MDCKFKDCCFLCVSINKAPDLNFVTFFFISAAQLLIHVSMTVGFVKGTKPSLLFKAMNRDQLSEPSVSSSSLLSCFLFLGFGKFGICLFSGLVNIELKGAAMLPCKIVHHHCPHPLRSVNSGNT